MAKRQSKDPLERLDTPFSAVRALLKYVPGLHGLRVIEPCAGAGHISDILIREGRCRVESFDIEPRAGGIIQCDTNRAEFWHGAKKDTDHGGGAAVVTNTPFSLGANYWRNTQDFLLVALLVRLTWLEKTKDREDIEDPDALIILPRLKFTGPGAVDPETGKPYTGGDSVTVAWAIWSRFDCLLDRDRPIMRVDRQELKTLGG